MSETPGALARSCYETVEPFHLLAYFNPGLAAAQREVGLDASAFYVGARAAPMGSAHAAVVTAAFYNFSPEVIDAAWSKALGAGLAAVDDARYRMLDEQFGTILGDAASGIVDLLPEYAALTERLPLCGRPLAAAWAASPIPEAPQLALWRHLAVLREWRGDNHIAELVRHGLTGLEAGVLHEAELPDPTVKRKLLGRKFFQLSRGWSDADWDGAVATLVDRALVEPDGDSHRLTDDGFGLYQDIEDGTDEISGVAFDEGAADLLARTRPLVKAVIDAGVLPGTRRP